MPSATGQEPLREISRGLPPSVPRPWLSVLLMAQAGLVVFGNELLGRPFPKDIAQFYLMFALIPLILDDKYKHELLKQPIREYAIKFILGFLGTLMVFWLVLLQVLHLPVGTIAESAVMPMLALQALFVAPVEELVFRGFAPRLMDPKGETWRIYAGVTVGAVLAALFFSGFHFGAFGRDNAFPYVITFVLAIVWTVMSQVQTASRVFHSDGRRRPMGIAFTAGSHLAWNACVLGILTGGVLVGV